MDWSGPLWCGSGEDRGSSISSKTTSGDDSGTVRVKFGFQLRDWRLKMPERCLWTAGGEEAGDRVR